MTNLLNPKHEHNPRISITKSDSTDDECSCESARMKTVKI